MVFGILALQRAAAAPSVRPLLPEDDPTRESLLLLQLQLLPPQCTLARNFKTDFCAPWSRCRNSAAFHQKLKVPSPAVVASGGTGLWMPSWNLPVVFSNRLFKWVALPT